MARKLAAGNWKMNGTGDSLAELEALAKGDLPKGVDVLICPPATLISRAAEHADKIAIGGQDCHAAASGAHTGDLSAEMLRDAGASYVILGHSERRADHGESDEMVRAKTDAAHGANLVAVVCIGETLEEREAGSTLQVVGMQLAGSLPDGVTAQNTVVAYEPVWAIGTGKVPTLEQIAEVHNALRDALVQRFGNAGADVPLLYGGSVKPGNAAEIFAVSNVDGALVGGASLKSADFAPIIAALAAS
ncbi:triose-phosphate isomerase [Epibacterium sp. DP7N7-1]|uniref:triose-phosphate isomerase n=1 Tax=Tritonibacter mobilis TaxID=379347 RepID=UPI001402E9EE|nr:triose-phosphate isomerase [Tritonibacter mobilis]MBW3245707.1 triose-phosphate isomerase [Epibacterium sp. DP7N7-1]NHM18029.1 triose-phosphate isomerase [Tritonibacter mobilis]NHM22128.1 triose-phosphate isomerase [Tritonibacter mobilis]